MQRPMGIRSDLTAISLLSAIYQESASKSLKAGPAEFLSPIRLMTNSSSGCSRRKSLVMIRSVRALDINKNVSSIDNEM